MKNTQHNLILNLVLSAMFLALAIVLPFLTGQVQELGSMLSPMHIAIFLCGLICGWQYGLVVGLVAPLLRFVMFGMPPIYPTGLAMSIELATYGFTSGIFYLLFQKVFKNHHLPAIILSLIISMLIGRIMWGLTRYVIVLFDQQLKFTFQMFLKGAFITAWPGIVLHLILIPTVMMTLIRAKIIFKGDK